MIAHMSIVYCERYLLLSFVSLSPNFPSPLRLLPIRSRLKTADAREDNFSDAGWDDHDNHFGPSLDRLEDTLDRAGALNAEAEDDIDAGDGSDTANDDAGLGGANDLEEQGATRMTHQKSSKLTTSSVGTRKLPLAAKHPSRRGDG